MGQHLNRAKRFFGTDTRGLLEGGRYALLHTRSMEFDDLRPYVPGDDVRDIDWKATARSGTVLIKRFVSEKHHKILLVADAGRNMTALAAGGETKLDVAEAILGAIGLITLGRSDEIGMVYGDTRGCVSIRPGRGETHIESMLDHVYRHTTTSPGPSRIEDQLRYVATHYRRPMLVIVVSDEPDVTAGLDEVTARLAARHDMLWVFVSDMPAVSGDGDGYDVTTGAVVPSRSRLGRRVEVAYRRAEKRRRARLEAFLTTHAIPFTAIGRSDEIRSRLTAMAEVFARAG
ncbi:DUF58 domain-containing protein [Mycolicibacterium aichiense]|uniref:DUF58 domain-containing protein n=1 Tax=Mycolicibacterium aichiense TaxID=1799 RepID=A0AAD1HMN9_9MYCO|nr:DUF58 domain-containing protein [Mycolicibacterium aichiense]MCV7019918.1 DUF58 domain-containing protein [Mycolicibacterium aichiense]BBX07509.1 hypothetical protein MAIC_23120 [Mycolicibacterium aichiense]STZ81323.1 lipoprotein [Mycolicibacterium aichiense]